MDENVEQPRQLQIKDELEGKLNDRINPRDGIGVWVVVRETREPQSEALDVDEFVERVVVWYRGVSEKDVAHEQTRPRLPWITNDRYEVQVVGVERSDPRTPVVMSNTGTARYTT